MPIVRLLFQSKDLDDVVVLEVWVTWFFFFLILVFRILDYTFSSTIAFTAYLIPTILMLLFYSNKIYTSKYIYICTCEQSIYILNI